MQKSIEKSPIIGGHSIELHAEHFGPLMATECQRLLQLNPQHQPGRTISTDYRMLFHVHGIDTARIFIQPSIEIDPADWVSHFSGKLTEGELMAAATDYIDLSRHLKNNGNTHAYFWI